MSERSLGDRWAEARRARGDFVLKLPASTTAGIPDWLVCAAPYGLQLFEAKLILDGPYAYDPERQLTAAQRFLLAQIARRWKPAANVLLLHETGFLEIRYTARRMVRRWFDVRKRRYV